MERDEASIDGLRRRCSQLDQTIRALFNTARMRLT
jgi:hypothetical protein